MSEVKNPALPERINVMKLFTYEVEAIVKEICEVEGKNPDEVTIDDCLSRVEDDLSSYFGNTRGLVYQDEYGNDL